MKKTVFSFLSLSTAVSTMGYAADVSLPPEGVPTEHTPEAANLRIDSNRPAPAVTASTVPQPKASDLILTVSNADLTTPGESIPCASSTASPIAEDLAETVTAQESAEERRLNLQQLAHGDDINAMYEYAKMLHEGQGGEQDLTEARRYYQQAVDLGHPEAMFNYAKMLHEGEGGEQDLTEARRYYQQAVDLGHPEAMFNYAKMLHEGEGGEQDLTEARRYYQQAVDLGHREAMFNYAKMLHEGEGGEQDLTEARRYYQQAVDLGHREAMFNYAKMLYHGRGGPQDLAEARRYYQQAAALGNAKAMNNYALMLRHAQGGEPDLAEARNYLHQAADLGNAAAMFNYAEMLHEGEGGEPNLAAARRYYQQAAALGDAEAMYNYAGMLYQGRGGPQDLAEARRYFQQAADLGNARAMHVLAREQGANMVAEAAANGYRVGINVHAQGREADTSRALQHFMDVSNTLGFNPTEVDASYRDFIAYLDNFHTDDPAGDATALQDMARDALLGTCSSHRPPQPTDYGPLVGHEGDMQITTGGLRISGKEFMARLWHWASHYVDPQVGAVEGDATDAARIAALTHHRDLAKSSIVYALANMFDENRRICNPGKLQRFVRNVLQGRVEGAIVDREIFTADATVMNPAETTDMIQANLRTAGITPYSTREAFETAFQRIREENPRLNPETMTEYYQVYVDLHYTDDAFGDAAARAENHGGGAE